MNHQMIVGHLFVDQLDYGWYGIFVLVQLPKNEGIYTWLSFKTYQILTKRRAQRVSSAFSRLPKAS